MSKIAIKVENLSKAYQLGEFSTGTITRDIERWLYKICGKEDPFLKIVEKNDHSLKGNSNMVWSLRDVDFKIDQGDAVGIIGRNGAGKSTLLKILSRVTSPTSGKVKVKGRIASLLEVGTGFHPELTGRENIFLNGAILGMRKNEIIRKFDEIVAFSGVERYIDTPVKRYSSGMYVRLAFAVAAHLESEILIIDEVLAVGDAEFQKKCLGKMNEVSKKEGRTILFVTHNMAAVKTLCTLGIILKQGRLVSVGQASELVSEYLSNENLNSKRELSGRVDRVGNGNFRFVDVKIFDDNGNEISDLISGSAVNIRLCYETNSHIDESKLIIGINFNDNLQNNVFTIISDEMNARFSPLSKTGLINFDIDSLNLRGEQYFIRLLAFEGSTAIEEALDIIENAAILNVLPGDIGKIGRVNRKGYSSIYPARIYN